MLCLDKIIRNLNLGRPPGMPSPGFSMSLPGLKGLKSIPPPGAANGSRSERPTFLMFDGGGSL